jgi:purine-binding chemotaxis protein CheW
MDTPQESLQNYFDDLLGEPAAQTVSVEPVVSEAPPVIVKPSPKTSENKKPFAEPQADQLQQEHRAKLKKLLETARLQAVQAEPEVEVVQELKQDVKQEVSQQVVSEAPVAEPEVKTEQFVEVETDVEVDAAVEEPEVDLQTLNQPAELQSLEWEANGRPRWAQGRFDVLLFDVAGLTLAVPLIALGQIQPLTDELTPLFGQADWFMGLQPTPVGKIRTVNTAKFVMPERYDESFLESAKYVVSISGLPWGLAVDKVDQPITLDPDDVKWRGERSKRAWLAGTVKAHMCALIDIPMMGQMLQSQDANT